MSKIKTPPRLVLPPGVRKEMKEASKLSDVELIDKIVKSKAEDIAEMRNKICNEMLSKGWGPGDCQLKEIFGLNEDGTLRYEVYFVDRSTGKRLTEEQIENRKPKPDAETLQ